LAIADYTGCCLDIADYTGCCLATGLDIADYPGLDIADYTGLDIVDYSLHSCQFDRCL
jgi:hypothetical protein